MISHLKNLFNNGYDNGGDIMVICENESITTHSWVLIECSEYYESIVPSSIIFLKQYDSSLVKLLFRILYSEDVNISFDSNCPLQIEDSIKFFELVDKFILKVDITKFCENIMENLKKQIDNSNFMDVLYLLNDVSNEYLSKIRYHIVRNVRCNDQLYYVIKNHIKNNNFTDLYKILSCTEDKSLPHYMFRYN